MPQVTGADETRRTYFGEKAATYDQGRETCEKWRREHEAVAEFLAGTTGTVLDIPVGTGRFLKLYRELGLKCIGMDVSDEMMAQARAKDPGADLRYGDILDIELPARSVESVVCIRLLALINEAEMVRAIKEMGRVARERIILSIRTGPRVEVHRRHFVHRTGEFGRAIAGAGFNVLAERIAREPNYRVVLLER